jgi:hypothetical protein
MVNAGKARAQAVEAVFDFVPQRRLPQAPLHARGQLGAVAQAGHARRKRHVVENGKRQPHRERRHHADFAAQRRQVFHPPDIFAIHPHGARHYGVGVIVDGAVDDFEQGGLAGLRRADHAQDFIAAHVKRDALEDFPAAEANPQVADLDHVFSAHHFPREQPPRNAP